MPAVKKYRKGFDSYFHYAEHLGQQLGQRHCLSARLYGDTPQKAGKGRRFSTIYSDPYRRWLQNDEGRIICHEIVNSS